MILSKFTNSLRSILRAVSKGHQLTLLNNQYKFSAEQPPNQPIIFTNLFQAMKLQAQKFIKQQQERIQSDEQVTKFLNQNNWTLIKKDRLLTLSREANGYHIKVLFWGNVEDAQRQQNEERMNQDQIKDGKPYQPFMPDIQVNVSKNMKKWLSMSYSINGAEIQANTISFIDDCQKQAIYRRKYLMSSTGYDGPMLQSLSQGFVDKIALFIESLGINQQFFENIYIIARQEELKSNIEWANQFIDIL